MSGAVIKARQFHYQPVASHVHPFLVDLWDAVRTQSGGQLDVSVHANNDGLKASHAEILGRVKDGEIDLYAVMGSLLGDLSPAFEIQGMPFAFASEQQVYAMMDGELGDYLRNDLAARGLYALPGGLMENGFRHISTVERPINSADDLAGLRIRVPEGRIFDDTFRSLGALPMPVFVLELRAAMAEGRVDAQENPLAITESLDLAGVTRHIALTSHMWSGFNLVANPGFWSRLGTDLRALVVRNLREHIDRQRAHTMKLNRDLEQKLSAGGIRFIRPDIAGFRARLAGGFYARWKKELGATAWSLLEAGAGRLV